MKKAIVFMAATGALILNMVWMMGGCKTQYVPVPPNYVATSTPTLEPFWISKFDDGTASVNPNLVNSNIGLWSSLPAGNIVAAGGANGTAYAAHLYAAPALMYGYTPRQLQVNPNSTGVYDVYDSPSTFNQPTNGIIFCWKTGLNDNMGEAHFEAPVPAQIPPPIGVCPSLPCPNCTPQPVPTTTCCGITYCYAQFGQLLNPTAGNWTTVTITWGALGQPGYPHYPNTGAMVQNNTFYNASMAVNQFYNKPNLSQILYFQWVEDPAGIPAPGTLMCADFWVDEVRLF